VSKKHGSNYVKKGGKTKVAKYLKSWKEQKGGQSTIYSKSATEEKTAIVYTS